MRDLEMLIAIRREFVGEWWRAVKTNVEFLKALNHVTS
jgi:hypothetical protein